MKKIKTIGGDRSKGYYRNLSLFRCPLCNNEVIRQTQQGFSAGSCGCDKSVHGPKNGYNSILISEIVRLCLKVNLKSVKFSSYIEITREFFNVEIRDQTTNNNIIVCCLIKNKVELTKLKNDITELTGIKLGWGL